MSTDAQQQNPLTVSTPSDTQIRIERTFDAPRELVWEAYTEPEMVAEWLGPHSQETPTVTMGPPARRHVQVGLRRVRLLRRVSRRRGPRAPRHDV